MKLRDISEATRPYEQKAVDPALMTFSDYRNMVNPDNKYHPSSAYDVSLEKMNSYRDESDYPILVNQIKVHQRPFAVRMKVIDKHEGTYTKTDADGDIVRDENGNAVFMSRDELEQAIPEDQRYHYDFAIYDITDDVIVGATSDEWGTLLVQVASEYRNFGFGTLLVKLVRDKMPKRQSGGFTYGGAANFKRVHDVMVRRYLENGFYSHLVKTNQISMDTVKQIVGELDDRKSHDVMNYNMNDPKDWLLMSDGSSYAILYNKNVFQFSDPDSEKLEYWITKHVIGMASIADIPGTNNIPWIQKLSGPKKVQIYLLSVLLSQEVGSPIRLDDYEHGLVSEYVTEYTDHDYEQNAFYAEKPIVDWQGAATVEKRYRKQYDPYDEWYARIIDWGENMTDG